MKAATVGGLHSCRRTVLGWALLAGVLLSVLGSGCRASSTVSSSDVRSRAEVSRQVRTAFDALHTPFELRRVGFQKAGKGYRGLWFVADLRPVSSIDAALNALYGPLHALRDAVRPSYPSINMLGVDDIVLVYHDARGARLVVTTDRFQRYLRGAVTDDALVRLSVTFGAD